VVGALLPMAAILTCDADIAQDYAVSHEDEDSLSRPGGAVPILVLASGRA